MNSINHQEADNDWFEDFANGSKKHREISISQIIMRNTKEFAKKHKRDTKDMDDGKETGNLLRAMKKDKD